MRIYELARILGVTSKDLITELKKIRVSVKSASSSIEDKHVRKVMDRWEKRKAELEEKKKKEKEEAARRKKEEAERKKREAEEKKKREAEEKKKREEEERRKREEERKRREEERKKRAEERKKRQQEIKKTAAEAKSPAPEATAEAEKPVKEERPAEARRGKKRAKAGDQPLQITDLPKIEVMKLEDPRKLYAERARRRAKERKKDKKGKTGEVIEEEDTTKERGDAGRKKHRRIRPSFVVSQKPKRPAPQQAAVPAKPAEPRKVQIRGEVTVGQFAEKIGVEATDVIAKLLSLGEARTINQMLDEELCELLGMEFGVELEIIPESDEYDLRQYEVEDNEKKMARRSPVVTIMGHVDHGKTTLLDYIRNSRVVEGEYGGITQHIGAYRVATSRGEITFLDTPGHEAFTSMRARGAQATDIVVLVVAADDGVMPQTVEAMDHARAGQVPIIVAVNKIDKPEANPARVQQELMRHSIVPEELGGEHIVVPVSAKTGDGVDHLLEMIALQAEILELKADPDRRAEGIVVEARVDSTRGSVCTLLVQKGTLEVGDTLVIGQQFGRVRAMVDDFGRPVEEAGPSHPVEVLGLGGSPEAGEHFLVMPDERAARNVASLRDDRRRARLLGSLGQRHVSLENLHEMVEEGKIQEFRIILKGDVQGSIEAISQALGRIQSAKIKLRILRAAVGAVTEYDVTLAVASEAVLIGFNVRPDVNAQIVADREGIKIMLYQVIYELIDDVRKAMTATLIPETREVPLGRAEVRQVFRISSVGNVAGCFVSEGEVRRGARARLVRDGVVIYTGKISSLRRVKDDVERVQNGVECGINLENYQDIKADDILEVFTTEEIPVEL